LLALKTHNPLCVSSNLRSLGSGSNDDALLEYRWNNPSACMKQPSKSFELYRCGLIDYSSCFLQKVIIMLSLMKSKFVAFTPGSGARFNFLINAGILHAFATHEYAMVDLRKVHQIIFRKLRNHSSLS
jgi:hypothetical protein